MAFLLSPEQCFFIGVIAFGFIGFMRGWRREVISMGFVLGGVLFLLLAGGTVVTQLVFVRFPEIFQYITTGKVQAPPPQPSANTVLLVTLIAFALIVVLGYIVGNGAFKKDPPLTPGERLLGIVPGLVTGFFLVYYVSNTFAISHLITLGVGTPTQNLLSNYIPLIFFIAIVLVIIGLIASRVKKAPAKK
ncbi:MAG: hypothetical protein NVS3B14_23240 [Ktedonobacteraceae bacterium]